MLLKAIQVNIWHGRFLTALLDFLRAEAPDIVTMQEVAGGAEYDGPDEPVDTYTFLRDGLGYGGALGVTHESVERGVQTYCGNAVLVRGAIRFQRVVWLREPRPGIDWQRPHVQPDFPRSAMEAEVEIGGRLLRVLSVHGAWTREPVDTPEKLSQAHRLAEHLRSLGDVPFILGIDANMPPQSAVVQTLDAVAHNAVRGSAITRTTHPTIHTTVRTKPAGLLVDYIYTSPHFRVVQIDAPEVAVTDHLPVRAVLEWV